MPILTTRYLLCHVKAQTYIMVTPTSPTRPDVPPPNTSTAVKGSECNRTSKQQHRDSAQFRYCQVGVIRAAQKGRKFWNPAAARKGSRATSLGIPTDPTLGSVFLACSFTNLQRKMNLTNAFKSFFRDDSFKLCNKSLDSLKNSAWGSGGRARKRLRSAKLAICH